MSVAIKQLRKSIEQRFPDAVPPAHRTAVGLPTGVVALDRVLPAKGLPRGRLSTWAPGGGATAVLRKACEAVVGRGERAAWVDGAGLVVGEWWSRGPLLLRPAGETAALMCAEELLRSGGFGLVVVMGVGRTLTGEAVRLSRAASEGGTAFVAVADTVSVAAVRLASRIRPDGYHWRRNSFGEPVEPESVTVRVEVASMGWSGSAEFTLSVVHHDVRLSLEPGLVDRRGAGI